jgi:AhpC/TSA family./Protein of unknown function (DUF3738).
MVVLYKGMKGGCVFVGFLLLGIVTSAQSSIKSAISQSAITNSSVLHEVRELKVGDVVPDITFQNVLNYNNKTARLSDFKGKLVIFYMWSIWCTPCLKAFPDLDKLQNQFSGKIQILLANPHAPKYNTEERIKTLLTDRKNRTGYYPALPIPINDTILNLYFPHVDVPHVVWVNQKGELAAITSSKELTGENIQNMLGGKNLIPYYEDVWTTYANMPMQEERKTAMYGSFIFRAYFTNYNGAAGVGHSIKPIKSANVSGIYLINQSLLDMIRYAYMDVLYKFGWNRVILNVNNISNFTNEAGDTANLYCYNLLVSATTAAKLNERKFLQEDLRRVFNISVQVEKQVRKCLVITASDKLITYQTADKKQSDSKHTSVRSYGRYQIAKIISRLQRHSSIPLIDETNLREHLIDFEFPDEGKLLGEEKIISELKRAGFNLSEEEREIEVVVITDK